MKLYWILLISLAMLRPITVPANDLAWVSIGEPVRALDSGFFGFNLEWIPFQLSAVDPQGRVSAELIERLRVFEGAYYRYPGGTVSNKFDWRKSIGAVEFREGQISPWGSRIRNVFGLSEYFEFVRAVRGRPWYVLSLHGGADCIGDRAADAECVSSVARSTRNLMQWVLLNQIEGRPQPASAAGCSLGASCPVMYWELGNETDHGKSPLSKEAYVVISRAVAGEVKEVFPQASMVPHMATSPWGAIRSKTYRSYNVFVIDETDQYASDYAYHIYYDGISTRRASALVGDELAAMLRRSDDSIWVTEHGKWPDRDPYKHSFSVKDGPTNHEAALSNADFLLKLSRLPHVRGAMAHALAGKGPWPMFFHDEKGALRTTAVFDALSVLRKSMVGTVLSTKGEVPEKMEVQAYMSSDESKLFVVVVNRLDGVQTLTVQLNQGLQGRFLFSSVCNFMDGDGDCVGESKSALGWPNSVRQVGNGIESLQPARSIRVIEFVVKS
ncbi:hypothetical protein GO613_04090 [Azoarcus communis]|uniref:hypothetical protein n=1 Tax=Parazoarcus communis TaxID=41977 RepID=UPI00145930F4|nr:hypothetical protein [Parazoarcus communis]NMG47279.1 hypothetical protein [Parazoarcus communis]